MRLRIMRQKKNSGPRAALHTGYLTGLASSPHRMRKHTAPALAATASRHRCSAGNSYSPFKRAGCMLTYH
eukprot:GDKH01012930.1.p1 GENE.GDKH01012930.1~~GDKH01012930.1.p1  ORF type:complete len:70 (-),score=4.34 GDKH01012930.1:95-304(-)